MADDLGVTNNNPTNIRYTGIRWQGLADPPHDARGFCVFTTATDGLLAGAKNLRAQQTLHRLDTISAIITKLSPPTENDTASYIVNVARRMGRGSMAVLNLSRPDELAAFLAAVVSQEVGEGHYPPLAFLAAATDAISPTEINSPVEPAAVLASAPAPIVSSAVTAGGTIGAATLVPFVTWAMVGFAGPPPANTALLIAAGLASLAHLLYNRLTHD